MDDPYHALGKRSDLQASTPARQAKYTARYVERAAIRRPGSPTAASLASIAVALILNGRLETRIESINDRVGGRGELLGSRSDRVAADLSRFYMIFCRDDKAIETLETK